MGSKSEPKAESPEPKAARGDDARGERELAELRKDAMAVYKENADALPDLIANEKRFLEANRQMAKNAHAARNEEK